MKQWPSEISKFAKGLNVVKIVTIVDLKKLSIQDIQEADVIVTTSSIFKSEALWAQTLVHFFVTLSLQLIGLLAPQW